MNPRMHMQMHISYIALLGYKQHQHTKVGAPLELVSNTFFLFLCLFKGHIQVS